MVITCTHEVSTIGLFLHVARHKIETTTGQRSMSPERDFSGHISGMFRAGDYEESGFNVILKMTFFCQGAIFLYYAGRIKQVQGNLDEVSTFLKLNYCSISS